MLASQADAVTDPSAGSSGADALAADLAPAGEAEATAGAEPSNDDAVEATIVADGLTDYERERNAKIARNMARLRCVMQSYAVRAQLILL